MKNKIAYTCSIIAICGIVMQPISAQRKYGNKPVVVEAESGKPGRDVQILSDGNIKYVTPKTNYTDWSVPKDTDSMVSYSVTFNEPGYYMLYAHVRVGKEPREDDSFFAGKGFGIKEIKKENWILVNELYSWGYTDKTSVVDSAGTAGGEVWKWINVSKGFCAPAIAKSCFFVEKANSTKIFQIATREDGLWIDKFVFGKVGLTFTVDELNKGVAQKHFKAVASTKKRQ